MQFLLLSALAGSALAGNLLAVVPRELQVRQSEAFNPDETTTTSCRTGESLCPGEFEGYPYCHNPSLGDVCCSQGYACPGDNGGSFCLVDGYCCPTGEDPETCAIEFGITLPDDFGSSSVAPTSPATTAPTTPASTPVITSESSSLAVITTSVAPTTPPYIIPSNTTTPVGTATGTVSGYVPGQTSLTPFTGAASVNAVGAKGVVAALFGAGLVAALL